MKVNSEILTDLSSEEKKIFDLLQKQGSMSKNEILIKTEMKLTTLNNVMRPLEASKIIVQKYIGESTGGRKPTIYGVNSDKFYIVGIDISRLYYQVVITNLNMKILYKEIFYMDGNSSPNKTVNHIVEIINTGYSSLKLQGEILGVGLGTVGPLDIKSGIIINPVDFLAEGWANVPIKAMLEEKLGCEVFIENGANTAVMAEFLYGFGKNTENIAYFHCGVGIRSGTISSGKLIRSVNDEEDAFGHMIISLGGEGCRCGNLGCIEAYCSINSIIKKYGTLTKDENLKESGFIDICIAAENQDKVAMEVIKTAATVLGTGLVNYINLLNPKVVILSGPLIMHSQLFYEVCIKIALNKLSFDKGKKVTFSRGGDFKEDAISVGASALVIEKYLGKMD